MAVQTVFKRYEFKYMLTTDQKQAVLQAMNPYMQPDTHGRTTVRNLYFDTDTFLLIRRSIEKPAYKEKLRIRSYARADVDDMVFVELKKKYQSVVYKRRVALPQDEAMKWVTKKTVNHPHTQICKEIDYVIHHYENLHPTVFLSYEREAFYATDDSGFRVTFDENILCRQDNLTLNSEPFGSPILPPGKVLMEIKCFGGIPLWMVRVLSREKLYKTSFSKYGTAYKTLIFKGDARI